MQSVWKESLGIAENKYDQPCKDCGTGTVMESSGVPDTALWYLHCEAIHSSTNHQSATCTAFSFCFYVEIAQYRRR